MWLSLFTALSLLAYGGAAAVANPAPGPGPGPDVVGRWSPPFEEGGAATPRCQQHGGRTVCKPVGQATAVLPDGTVFYFSGLEGDENVNGSYLNEAAPSMRNSRSRILDLRREPPQWSIPTPEDGGGVNPDIRPGQKSTDDPFGMAGVPGRPGDGLVGSAWGQAGGPSAKPTSPPDDPQHNDADLFCSDVAQLPDGRLLIVGGSDFYNDPDVMMKDRGDPADVGVLELGGIRTSWVFDGATKTFTPAGPMNYARWYPTAVSLADGTVLVASGVTKLVRDTQASQVRRTETYDPATNRWSENYSGPASENSLPVVARLFLAPNGKVFYTGGGTGWAPLGQAADEATWNLQQFFDPATKRWEITGPAPLGFRGGDGEVTLTLDPPYDGMRILAFGGTLGTAPSGYLATPLSTITTITRDGAVSSRPTGDLHVGRWFASGVLLPDGEVFAVNGADRDELVYPGPDLPVHAGELYDPGRGIWTRVGDEARDRAYHSSAVLLPDGRVLVGGHAPGGFGYGHRRDLGPPFTSNDKDPSFEIWSPPYLFRETRPVIDAAPSRVSWGETFPIRTAAAPDVDSVVLMRTPSAQHTIDADQRGLRLEFTRHGDELDAVAPPSGTVAPPGYYYLFVNRRTGQGPVPSVARIVHLGSSGP